MHCCNFVFVADDDDNDEEAQLMINCDNCGLWVHLACDNLSQLDYDRYGYGVPGYERYECPDCRRGGSEHTLQLWRTLERLAARVQSKRVAFSPDLVSSKEVEVSSSQERFP